MMKNIRQTANCLLLIFVSLLLCSIIDSVGASQFYDNNDTKNTIINNMKLVYTISYSIDPSVTTTMQSILLQETGGGVSSLVGNPTAPKLHRSYGLMQIQVATARSVLTRHPDLCFDLFSTYNCSNGIRDDAIIDVLLHDPVANIKIATYNFQLYLEMSKGSWVRAVAGYNAGIGAALKMKNPAKFTYVREISRKQSTLVVPFNEQHDMLTPDE